MLYMVQWKTNEKISNDELFKKFIENKDDIPDGLTQMYKFHEIGSKIGWIIFDTNDHKLLYDYTIRYNKLFSLSITPIINDIDARNIYLANYSNLIM